ncbi:MAG: glutaminase [Acidimicrobiia bacterium]|nr:glutaminase [Acidimicrobiia bacterium]
MPSNETTERIDRQLLQEVVERAGPLTADGEVADYIPALAEVARDRLALAVAPLAGRPESADPVLAVGAGDEAFSIQSISKIFTLTLAMQRNVGARLWDRVGREPSGDPFNSIVLLEREEGVPRNPFINAGAILVADVLAGAGDDPIGALVSLVSELAGADIAVDERVAASEAATGYRNRSLAYLMRSFGNLVGEVEHVLDIYFQQCSLSMTARQLARATRYLANDGIDPSTGRAVLDPLDARRINALMLMAGTYDAAGAFAYEIGIPCKSGVGGGIVGIVPDQVSICAWSPALDQTGNSLAGRAMLASLVSRSGLSVF